MRAPAYLQPALERAHPPAADLDRLAVDRDAVAPGPDLGDQAAVGLPAVAQLDGARRGRVGLGPAAPGEREQARALGGGLRVAELDRRLQQGHVGVPDRQEAALQLQAVQPRCVDLPGLQLLAIEQREQEALVGRAAFHDDHRLGQRAAQPRDRLRAVAAPGDQLDYQRVEVGRDHVAFGHAGVDPDAGARGEAQQRDPARRGQEAERRILGVEAGLDRVARRVRRLALQPAARGHVQLELDEVKPGDRLGHRVLDLQAGVDFHEREAALRGLVEELNGPRVAVARAQRQPARRLHHLALLLGGQRRAGRLLDHLLVAAPAAAVAQADRPRRALAVRDHLDLDLAGRRHEPLEEQRAVAERLQRLRPRARKDGGQLAGRVHAADPAPAAAGRRLDHEREADPLRVALSLLEGLDRAAAPWRDRDAGRLGQPLGLDLVADAAHHRRVRADEHDAQPVAELDKLRVLGHEAPADPRRVGAGGPQRTLERRVIQVRAAAGAVRCRDRARSHADGLVGVADEHRLALRVGVERDEADLLVALVVELADGANDPHRGLAAVDDRQAAKTTLHQLPLIAERIGSSALASRPPRRSIVP